jgi:anti-sigma regulatory factor (Ser/Thr protein kinase)
MALERRSRRTLAIRNDDAELRRMSAWFRSFAAETGFPDDRALDFELCLNELVTNVIHHAYEDDREHEIRITLEGGGEEIRATVEDDGRPFDPSRIEPPAPARSLADTRIGGWGVPIVHALADEIVYERQDSRNRLKIVSRPGGVRTSSAPG